MCSSCVIGEAGGRLGSVYRLGSSSVVLVSQERSECGRVGKQGMRAGEAFTQIMR